MDEADFMQQGELTVYNHSINAQRHSHSKQALHIYAFADRGEV